MDTRMDRQKIGQVEQSAQGVFDVTGTLGRLGGDRGLLSDLIDLFSEDAPVWLGKMKNAVTAGRAGDLRHSAHALRGLAANFGAERLTSTLLEVEEKAGTGTIDGTANLVDEAQQEVVELQHALAPHRKAEIGPGA